MGKASKTKAESRFKFIGKCQLSRLKPFKGNPRMNDDAVEAVARSLERFGAIAPIIVNEAFEVCAGHTRLKAAIEIGRKTFPVLVVPSLVGADFRGYNIADNQTASLAEWDNEGLAAALRELADEDFDLECLGFNGNELEELLAQTDESQGKTDPDEIPDPPEKPVTKTGDLWLLGDHRLLCGDATKAEDIERLLAGEKGGLVLTDPPYGLDIVKGVTGQAGFVRRPGGRPAGVLKGRVGRPGVVKSRLYAPIYGDDKPFDPTRLLALGKNQIIFGGGYFSHKLPESTAWLCWDKGISDETTFSGFELAWTSYEGRYRIYRHRWSGMVREGPRTEELKDRVHPTQKPVGLFAAIIDDITKSQVAVIDPYLGSGTTIIACEKLGRKCYGIEIEPQYVDVCCERFFRFSGKEPIRERGNAKWSNVKRAKRTTEDS